MPELPDVVAYIESLERVVKGQRLTRLRMFRPFLLRTFSPPISEVEGKVLMGVSRLGKRIVFEFEDDLFLVLHLMIAGRLLWGVTVAKPGKYDLAAFDFENGTVLLYEAGTKRRASLHLLKGRKALAEHSRGGIEALDSSLEEFAEVIRRSNRTLKRVLTDPSTLSGIGNAYSDEILFAAKISPVRLTGTLNDEEIARLHEATKSVLMHWVGELRKKFEKKFPGKGDITAFRDGFAVHGRYRQPCTVCGMPIQRIVHEENETNYCARCQNEDRLLADRALSRLLKSDWPKTLEEMLGEGPSSASR